MAHEPEADEELDGCEMEFDDPSMNTRDDQLDALVMFADCWDDDKAVEARRVELVEWATAVGTVV